MDGSILTLPLPNWLNLGNPSSVKARSSASIVHADLECPVGNVRLWVQRRGDGLGVDALGAVGIGVAEVGGRQVVRGCDWLWSLLGVLRICSVEVLSWGVVNCLTLLLLLVGLLTLLLVGLFDVTVMCTVERRGKELHCWLAKRVNAAHQVLM